MATTTTNNDSCTDTTSNIARLLLRVADRDPGAWEKILHRYSTLAPTARPRPEKLDRPADQPCRQSRSIDQQLADPLRRSTLGLVHGPGLAILWRVARPLCLESPDQPEAWRIFSMHALSYRQRHFCVIGAQEDTGDDAP